MLPFLLITRAQQIVEILFARGLVKVLFATETFAMVSLFTIDKPQRRCLAPYYI